MTHGTELDTKVTRIEVRFHKRWGGFWTTTAYNAYGEQVGCAIEERLKKKAVAWGEFWRNNRPEGHRPPMSILTRYSSSL